MMKFQVIIIFLAFCLVIAFGAPAENACKPNAEYKICGFSSPPRCGKYEKRLFKIQCVESGCECKDGFLLNSKDDCVRPQDC
ncbi:chymotrypsin inhibitor-like [Leptopilina heterotoma]|uniref:chymotrypsin inhibitor-like n=1 Tax=Leptopilina heterotoma TaxID=63436 RepID=UPI001CAA0E54|nr:chymotrypsin inhibitor-like [Leptopilina heterotoma]